MGFCKNCECPDCQRARYGDDQRSEAKEMCRRWNWNNHPIEIAQELKELDDDTFKEVIFEELQATFGQEAREQIEEYVDYV